MKEKVDQVGRVLLIVVSCFTLGFNLVLIRLLGVLPKDEVADERLYFYLMLTSLASIFYLLKLSGYSPDELPYKCYCLAKENLWFVAASFLLLSIAGLWSHRVSERLVYVRWSPEQCYSQTNLRTNWVTGEREIATHWNCRHPVQYKKFNPAKFLQQDEKHFEYKPPVRRSYLPKSVPRALKIQF